MMLNRILLISIFLIPIALWGQENVNVEIKILELGYFGKKRDAVYKFYLDSINGTNLNTNGKCYFFSRKDDTKRFYAAKDTALAGKNAFLQTFSRNSNRDNIFSLWMVAYDKSKGEPCVFSNKDNAYSESSLQLNLNDFGPGNTSDTIRMIDSIANYYAVILMKQSLPPPSKITPSTNTKILPANEPITFSSSFPILNKRGLVFQWEYSLGENEAWRPILTRPKDTFSITITPLQYFFDDKLRQTQKVLIRLKAMAKDTFVSSEPLYVLFTPKAPSVEKYDVKIVKTCTSTPTGSIIINNINSELTQIGYIIIKSNKNQPTPICNLQNPTIDNCQGLIKNDKISGRNIEIKRLPAGTYILMLFNPNMDVDKVYTSIPFAIEPLGEFALDNFEVRNPSCENPNPGMVSFTMKGGDWERANLVLEPVSGISERNLNEVIFKQLSGNQYTLTVTDGCGNNVKEKFQILGVAPKLIVETLEPIKVKTQNGIDYRVTLKNGIGPYKVTFKDNKGRLVTETKLSSDFIINFPLGKIDLNILDEKDPKCMKVDIQIEVSEFLK
jgi:hypothetical protein